MALKGNPVLLMVLLDAKRRAAKQTVSTALATTRIVAKELELNELNENLQHEL